MHKSLNAKKEKTIVNIFFILNELDCVIAKNHHFCFYFSFYQKIQHGYMYSFCASFLIFDYLKKSEVPNENSFSKFIWFKLKKVKNRKFTVEP